MKKNRVRDKCVLRIVRQVAGGDLHLRSFSYEIRSKEDTVATALRALQSDPDLRDIEGNAATPPVWECGCMQKKCGACAMLVNGDPALACGSRLCDLPERITLAPLRKYPVVVDLMADRSRMQENLRRIRLWMKGQASFLEKTAEDAYEASRCLQCGLCLEVCPNFDPAGAFTGMASAVPAARVLMTLARKQDPALVGLYREHVFKGCGKSLACREICPARIDTGEMLAQSNAIAVWHRYRKQKQLHEKIDNENEQKEGMR